MRSIGLPELLVIFGGAVGLLFYGFIFFVLWKFYQMFGRINENIAGIRRALESNGSGRSSIL
jgi:hypothetical protein